MHNMNLETKQFKRFQFLRFKLKHTSKVNYPIKLISRKYKQFLDRQIPTLMQVGSCFLLFLKPYTEA